MCRKIVNFLIPAIIPCALLNAQEEMPSQPPQDTATNVIREYKIHPLTKKADSIFFDTTMLGFQNYNPAYKYDFAISFLGNTGQAVQSNYLNMRNSYSPFIFAKPFNAYLHDPYRISHYDTYKPFTQVQYVTYGTREKSEQLIQAIHTQNINPYANIGLLYDLIASRGVYLDQGTKENSFSIFGSYQKNIYSVFGNVSLNKMSQTENGGLIDMPQFEEHIAGEPEAYRMFLEDAGSRIKKKNFFLTQTLNLSGKEEDTLKNSKQKESFFRLNHTFNYTRYDKIYEDVIIPGDTLDYYRNNYYLIDAAYDSASTTIVENSLQISGDQYKFLPGFIAGFRHQYQKYGLLYPDSSRILIDDIPSDTVIANKKSSDYNNMALFFALIDDTKERLSINGTVEYFFAGYRQNDLLADFSITFTSKNKSTGLTAAANFYLTEPDFFLKDYSSSHFKWNNNFKKTSNTGASVTLNAKRDMLTLTGGLNLLGNYIFIDTLALPASADDAILYSYIRMKSHLRWKGFNLINKILLQESTAEEVIHLPLFSVYNSTFYENAFFRDELKFQLGFDFYYHTNYYADAFMPATGMFYMQKKRGVGNYPFLDPFLNLKIKRTRIFIKYTNSLAGMAGHNYFTAYGYPMNGGSLRFGLSWTFYD